MYFMLSLFIVNIFIALIIGVYCKLTTGICRCSRHLVGKVVIITGGDSGIGYEVAKNLAHRGARVILAGRYNAKGTAARDSIVASTGNSDVHCRSLDLASLASIKAFADDIIKNESRVDILINNADTLEVENAKTDDGLSRLMQINYFGHFLLTSLLLPALKASAPTRIINVSSEAHQRGNVDFDNLNNEKETKDTYNHYRVYQKAKLCNVLMTLELARRCEGTGVTVNCANPGVVVSNIMTENSLISRFFVRILKQFFKTSWEGAQTTIFLAVSPDLRDTSGKYYSDCHEKIPAKLARDKEVARKLWEVSEKLVGLRK